MPNRKAENCNIERVGEYFNLMILDFTQPEENKLLLKLVIENNILLKCLLNDISSMQADLMEIGEYVLPQKTTSEQLELLKINRRNLSERIDVMHDNYLDSMTPIIERGLREIITTMRNGNLEQVLEDLRNKDSE